jgi:hypothetical protein
MATLGMKPDPSTSVACGLRLLLVRPADVDNSQAVSQLPPLETERVSDSDGIRYVDTFTGEVLWVDPGSEDGSHPEWQ